MDEQHDMDTVTLQSFNPVTRANPVLILILALACATCVAVYQYEVYPIGFLL